METDIIRMALEAGFLKHANALYTNHRFGDCIGELERFASLVAAAEQDRCCKIIYSMAGSDNVAQRTVDAIRGKQ